MVTTKGKEGGASLRPKDQVEGGGLLDNVDATWKEVEFTTWDYAGTRKEAVTALRIAMDIDDGEDAEQYWSCGGTLVPSKDGKKLVGGAVNKTSNFGILINSLVEAGYPEDKISDDCSVFKGLKCHMVRIPAPKRGGGIPAKTTRTDGREFEKTILVVDSIIKLPWEASEKSTGKDTDQPDAITEKAIETIATILKANPKGIEKNKLAGSAFTLLKKDGVVMTEVNAIAQLLRKDAFLDMPPMTDEGPAWEYEKGVVSPVA